MAQKPDTIDRRVPLDSHRVFPFGKFNFKKKKNKDFVLLCKDQTAGCPGPAFPHGNNGLDTTAVNGACDQ